jgi:hypothetical protein
LAVNMFRGQLQEYNEQGAAMLSASVD